MPAQHRAAPIALILIMPHQVARRPIRCLRRVKRPIITTGRMNPGIDLEAPGHTASARGHKHAACFLSATWEIGAATQIERIGMQPAFIQRDGRQQPFRYTMGDFGLACCNTAGGPG